MTPLPESLLNEIEEAASKATQGPWVARRNDECPGPLKGASVTSNGLRIIDVLSKTLGSQDDCEANAAFIARMDPPTALALVAAARRGEKMESALRNLKIAGGCFCGKHGPMPDDMHAMYCRKAVAALKEES